MIPSPKTFSGLVASESALQHLCVMVVGELFHLAPG